MISRRVIANLVVFFVVSLGLVAYGAVTLFGNPLRHRRTVVAELPDAAGLRTGFSASHDGVVVGTVSKVELRTGKVRVTVDLDPGETIPDGVQAKVIRASAVGEQRLDLVTTGHGTGKALPDGALVPLAKDPLPPDIADVVASVDKLVEGLPAEDLNTLVHELALGVDGRSDDLRSIDASLLDLEDDVVAVDPDLRRALEDGPAVLDAFTKMSPSAHRALADTEVLTRILADHDDDLARLLRDGGDLSTVADRMLVDDRASLTCLVGDLATIGHEIQGQPLSDLNRGLSMNQQFFGAIDRVAVRGESKDVGYGPAQSDALWLRTRLLVPPGSPSASRYSPPRSPRPVETGAACRNRFGTGSDAVIAPKTTGPGGAALAATSANGRTEASAAPGEGGLGAAAPGVVPGHPSSGGGPDLVTGALVLLALIALVALPGPVRRLRDHLWRKS